MYTSMAPYYDRLFPLQEDLAAYFKDTWTPSSILDVGCGTGSFLKYLQQQGWKCLGLEYIESMAQAARDKGLDVKQGGLADLPLTEGKWDHISCLGNTLPHAFSDTEVLEFLSSAQSLLSENGYLHIQLIRFEAIREQHPQGFSFPLLEEDGVSLKRSYQWRSDGVVDFITELKTPDEGVPLKESVPLLELDHHRMKELLGQSGWDTVQIEEGSLARIYHCS